MPAYVDGTNEDSSEPYLSSSSKNEIAELYDKHHLSLS